MLAILLACNGLPDAPPAPDSAEVRGTVDLAHRIGFDTEITGVTYSEDHSDWVVVDAKTGLYRAYDGAFLGRPDADGALSDIAYLWDDRYEVMAPNQGVQFASHNNETEYTHSLCGNRWVPCDAFDHEVSHAAAFDSYENLLVVQTATLDASDRPFGATVTVYDSWGTAEDRYELAEHPDFLAGAMAFDGSDVLLAKNDTLYRYELGRETFEGLVDLGRLGVKRIEGMVLDADDTLQLVDGRTQELLEIVDWRP